MSTFGSPGGRQNLSKPTPPERGSFPLDHDGECTHIMKSYLACLRHKRGINEDECRMLSKSYLECRMERGLMARDEMRNLGYATKEEEGREVGATVTNTKQSQGHGETAVEGKSG